MIDNDLEAKPPAPPRRPRRTLPPPRRGSNGHGADDPIATLLKQNQELLARLERLESGQMRYVGSTPDPLPDVRAVNPDALDPFTQKLWEERTTDIPPDFGGDTEPSYNVPLKLFLKSDGTYCWLQGDARSVAYYTAKGYYALNAAEVAEYEKLKPGIVNAQREKAHLITVIRRLIDSDNALAGHRDYSADGEDAELNLMTADELREKWRSLCAETTQPERPLPPPKRWRSEGRDRQMAGVETSADTSMEALEAKLEKARSSNRTIEVTGTNWNSFR